MALVHSDLHPADHTAISAMRAALSVTAKPVLGPDGRPGFDAVCNFLRQHLGQGAVA